MIFKLDCHNVSSLDLLCLYTCFLNDLKSMCKLFADEKFFFPVFHEVNSSASNINKDLELIGDWAFQ